MRQLKRRILVNETSSVSSAWSVPEGSRTGGPAVIIAHGAGNDMDSPFLREIHEGLARHGFLSVCFNFPYKERGGKAPDRPPLLEAAWRAVAGRVRGDTELAPGSLFLAGKSMGGRIASHIVAQGEPCDGLVFFGYPLHPAGKPEQLRVEHLRSIRCPMLFLEGTRDPLCDLGSLRVELAKLPADVTLHVVDGGDHSFNVPKRLARAREEVINELIAVAAGWMRACDLRHMSPGY